MNAAQSTSFYAVEDAIVGGSVLTEGCSRSVPLCWLQAAVCLVLGGYMISLGFML